MKSLIRLPYLTVSHLSELKIEVHTTVVKYYKLSQTK